MYYCYTWCTNFSFLFWCFLYNLKQKPDCKYHYTCASRACYPCFRILTVYRSFCWIFCVPICDIYIYWIVYTLVFLWPTFVLLQSLIESTIFQVYGIINYCCYIAYICVYSVCPGVCFPLYCCLKMMLINLQNYIRRKKRLIIELNILYNILSEIF